ncbi:integrase core domain-containing protein, partial [Novosphingobium sp. NDB2Meth1]|uniref:integrase core domain-containing protein n=1 Tax=Novosphingobium sp. NDB2Meth1 TaxID=1892847 RepID=UPI0015C53C47
LAVWRYDYNNERPHSSLANRTPARISNRWTLVMTAGPAGGRSAPIVATFSQADRSATSS